jgi:hypothetical protein
MQMTEHRSEQSESQRLRAIVEYCRKELESAGPHERMSPGEYVEAETRQDDLEAILSIAEGTR